MSIITIMSSNSMTMMFEKQPEAHNLFPSPSLSLSPFAGPWPTNRTRDPSEKRTRLMTARTVWVTCKLPLYFFILWFSRDNKNWFAAPKQPNAHPPTRITQGTVGVVKKVLQVVVPVPSIQLSQGRFIADFNAIPSRHLEYSLFFPSTPTFDPYVCLSVCFWICITARRT